MTDEATKLQETRAELFLLVREQQAIQERYQSALAKLNAETNELLKPVQAKMQELLQRESELDAKIDEYDLDEEAMPTSRMGTFPQYAGSELNQTVLDGK